MGMAHVPEGRRIFQNLTVYDNLKLGAFTRDDKKEFKENLERVYASFPRLEERKNQIAGTLSGGEQQMLAIGRGLMSNPKLMLLDEPSMDFSDFRRRDFRDYSDDKQTAQPSCWLSRTLKSPFPFQTEPMFSKPARLPLPILPRTL